MSEAALATALQDWRGAWPEWAQAEVFLPAQQRDLAVAWFTLQTQWFQAAWTGGDATPGLAKLAWWQEELTGWAAGRRRHPLGQLLLTQPVEWDALARALGCLRERDTAVNVEDERLAALWAAMARAEAALFSAADASAPAAGAMALTARMLAGLDVATHGDVPSSGTRPRRLLDALAAARINARKSERGAVELSRWRTLRTAWRAARRR